MHCAAQVWHFVQCKCWRQCKKDGCSRFATYCIATFGTTIVWSAITLLPPRECFTFLPRNRCQCRSVGRSPVWWVTSDMGVWSFRISFRAYSEAWNLIQEECQTIPHPGLHLVTSCAVTSETEGNLRLATLYDYVLAQAFMSQTNPCFFIKQWVTYDQWYLFLVPGPKLNWLVWL